MLNTEFTVRLDADDWNAEMQAWRCPALNIPGAELSAIFASGKKIDSDWYNIKIDKYMIRWILMDPPQKISAVIFLSSDLSLKAETNKWKTLTFISPIIASIGAALVSGFATYESSVCKNNIPAEHALHLEFEPSDTNYKDVASIKINGLPVQIPAAYNVKSDIKEVINISSIIKTQNSLMDLIEDIRNDSNDIAKAAHTIDNFIARQPSVFCRLGDWFETNDTDCYRLQSASNSLKRITVSFSKIAN